MTDTTVTLEFWWHPTYGDQWTLNVEGRPTLTFGSEVQARSVAAKHGWRVEVVDRERGVL